MRRVKRTADFELSLEVKNDGFIAPPRAAQRSWLVNRALTELAHELHALHAAAERFVPGVEIAPPADRSQTELDDQEIMEDWQLPIMRAMAEEVADPGAHVLEIGFGRGISAEYLQTLGVGVHTIVECNDSVVRRFDAWRGRYPDRDIRLVHARWQDAPLEPDAYDAVFFHTYPLDEDEFLDTMAGSTTYAEHFFEPAAKLLRPGGVFTYLTNEIDSFGREHQRRLLRYFDRVALQVVRQLELPVSVRDAWWADSMVVARATKGSSR